MNLWVRLPWTAIFALIVCLGMPAGTARAAAPNGAAIYQQEVQPLTTLECARCHFRVFEVIRDKGGRHQLECRFCHQDFHSWRPETPWSEVVPQCASCHGEFHSPEFSACLDCHTNPHAPLASLTDFDRLGQSCGSCHARQGREVQQFPSAHTEVTCSACHHDRHGFIPDCLECHAEPHLPYDGNAGCLSCHPVHAPLQISYGPDIANNICGTCHESVLKKLKKTDKKHGALYCVYCHADRHGFIPQCRNCHAQPHPEALLKKFGGCADCHGDPHALQLSN